MNANVYFYIRLHSCFPAHILRATNIVIFFFGLTEIIMGRNGLILCWAVCTRHTCKWFYILKNCAAIQHSALHDWMKWHVKCYLSIECWIFRIQCQYYYCVTISLVRDRSSHFIFLCSSCLQLKSKGSALDTSTIPPYFLTPFNYQSEYYQCCAKQNGLPNIWYVPSVPLTPKHSHPPSTIIIRFLRCSTVHTSFFPFTQNTNIK